MKKVLFVSMLLAMTAIACKTTEKSNAPTTVALKGTTWELTHLYTEPIVPALSTATMLLGDDGNLSGDLGCNLFFGTYAVNKNKISLSFNGSTKKLCHDMELEKKYATALKEEITHYTISGDTLIIKAKGVEIMRFKAQKAE